MLAPSESNHEAPKSPERVLNFLRDVGSRKPIGYLPKTTLLQKGGITVEAMREELEAKGLKVIDFDDEDTLVISGALVAYDPIALPQVLENGRKVLEKNDWSTDPEDFVYNCMQILVTDQDLYNLIADAFGDVENPRKLTGEHF